METLIPFKLHLPQKRLQQNLVFVRGMLLKPVLRVTFFFHFWNYNVYGKLKI